MAGSVYYFGSSDPVNPDVFPPVARLVALTVAGAGCCGRVDFVGGLVHVVGSLISLLGIVGSAITH